MIEDKVFCRVAQIPMPFFRLMFRILTQICPKFTNILLTYTKVECVGSSTVYTIYKSIVHHRFIPAITTQQMRSRQILCLFRKIPGKTIYKFNRIPYSNLTFFNAILLLVFHTHIASTDTTSFKTYHDHRQKVFSKQFIQNIEQFPYYNELCFFELCYKYTNNQCPKKDLLELIDLIHPKSNYRFMKIIDAVDTYREGNVPSLLELFNFLKEPSLNQTPIDPKAHAILHLFEFGSMLSDLFRLTSEWQFGDTIENTEYLIRLQDQIFSQEWVFVKILYFRTIKSLITESDVLISQKLIDITERYLHDEIKFTEGQFEQYLLDASVQFSKGYINESKVILEPFDQIQTDDLLMKHFPNYYLIKGNIEYVNKNYSEAIIYFKKAQEQFANAKDPSNTVRSLNNIALCFNKLQHSDKAKEIFHQAREICQNAELPLQETEILNNLGNLLFVENNLTEAKQTYEQALKLATQNRVQSQNVGQIGHNLGLLLYKSNQEKSALRHLNQALEYSELNQFYPDAIESAYLLAQIYKSKLDSANQQKMLFKAREMAKIISYPKLELIENEISKMESTHGNEKTV